MSPWKDHNAAASRVPVTDRQISDYRGATLLIGSGLSSDVRNGLPAGGTVSREIMKRLFAYSGYDFSDYWPHLSDTPFEQILDCHPYEEKLRNAISKHYKSSKYNSFQSELRTLIANGHVSCIVTTNYDCCIETALVGIDHKVIVRDCDISPISSAPVFKIHGCAGNPDTLTITLRHEKRMDQWKEELLRRLLNDKDVYVLGYSGRDFDVCPIVFSAKWKSLNWLERPDPISGQLDISSFSANLRFACENRDRFQNLSIVKGDFSHAFGVESTFTPATDASELVNEIFDGESESPDDFRLWAASLFQSISCQTVGSNILAKITETASNSLKTQVLVAEFQERSGHYRSAIQTLERCQKQLLRLAERGEGFDEAFRVVCLIPWRAYTGHYLGKFLFSLTMATVVFLRLRKLAEFNRELATARLSFLYMLFLRIIYITNVGKSFIKSSAVSSLVKNFSDNAPEIFYAHGLWQELYTMLSIRRDIGLPIDQGDHALLPEESGFTHLGNLLGQSALYRRTILKGDMDIGRVEYINKGLRMFGLHPEIWKMYVQLVSQGRLSDHAEYRDAREAYLRCQYGAFHRIAYRRELKYLKRIAT